MESVNLFSMGTIVKALKLLDFFSATQPEIGLTQFVRLSGYDKATTHRRLSELMEAGFIEQDTVTRSYRLGVAVLRLNNVREQVFPARKAVMPTLQKLSIAVQETVHISLLQGQQGLSTLAYIDNKTHGISVNIDPAEILPLHATASGVTVLAFADSALLEQTLASPLQSYTDATLTHADSLTELVQAARNTGFGITRGGYEAEVCGIARPLFNMHGNCHGAVAVATPVSRLNEATQTLIQDELCVAARAITQALGGIEPKGIFDNTLATALLQGAA